MARLDLNRIDLDELTTALQDQQAYDHRWLLDPRDGSLPPVQG